MPEESASSSSSPEIEASAPVTNAALFRQEGRPQGGMPSNVSAASSAKPFAQDSPLAGLPMQLDVTIPVPKFRVRDLLALEEGAVLDTRWLHSEDVPVLCGRVHLVWTEFEVVEHRIAVRVTRLA